MQKGDTFTYQGQTAKILWIAERDGSRQRPVRFQMPDGTILQGDAIALWID